MKKVIFLLFLLFLTFLMIFLLLPRNFVLRYFKVKNKLPERADLIAVLGGGAIVGKNITLGRASTERIKLGIKLLKEEKADKIFFAGYYGEQTIANKFLREEGIDNDKIIKFYKRDKKNYSTTGDLGMILGVVKKYGFKSVIIVTSPYHERRCKYLMDKILSKKKSKFKFYFAHIENNGEIIRCGYFRYLRLIFHEFFGLLFVKVFG